jgi:outer membrane protein assembly factor BamB
VNDLLLVGTFDDNKLYWGEGTATSVSVSEPSNISTDANGRVFVAEGSTTGARILRYHQQGPTGETVVADSLSGVAGMAVDPVGNIYAVEQGTSRIIVITSDGRLLLWSSDTIDPQYIAFTQY